MYGWIWSSGQVVGCAGVLLLLEAEAAEDREIQEGDEEKAAGPPEVVADDRDCCNIESRFKVHVILVTHRPIVLELFRFVTSLVADRLTERKEGIQ